MRHNSLLIAVMLTFFVVGAGSASAETQSIGWTPTANTTYVDPEVSCNEDITAAPGYSTNKFGIRLSTDNVTLINPHVHGCSVGIEVTGKNAQILFDPNKPGYVGANASRADVGIRNNLYGIRFAKGNSNTVVRGVNDGTGYIENTYRPVTVQVADSGRVSGLDITHPDDLPWGTNTITGTLSRSIVGIKLNCNFTELPSADKSCHDMQVTGNHVEDFHEEGISADPAGGDGVDSSVQGTAKTIGINPTADKIRFDANDINQPGTDDNVSLGNYVNAYVVFNDGGAVGRTFKIIGVEEAYNRIQVADPNNYLSAATVGDEVSIGSIYRNINFDRNVVDTDAPVASSDNRGANVGMSFGAFTFNSTMRNNDVVGTPRVFYMPSFNLRSDPSCGCNKAAPQAIRHSSRASMEGGPLTPSTKGSMVGISAYNSVTFNRADADISWNYINAEPSNLVPTFRGDVNQINAGESGQIYDDGSYNFLAVDPN